MDRFFAFTIKIAVANLDYLCSSGFGDDEWIVDSDAPDSEVTIFL